MTFPGLESQSTAMVGSLGISTRTNIISRSRGLVVIHGCQWQFVKPCSGCGNGLLDTACWLSPGYSATSSHGARGCFASRRASTCWLSTGATCHYSPIFQTASCSLWQCSCNSTCRGSVQSRSVNCLWRQDWNFHTSSCGMVRTHFLLLRVTRSK